MKKCPQCERTYSDGSLRCPEDASLLSGVSDAEETSVLPAGKSDFEGSSRVRRFSISTSSLRAYTMLGALVVIWLFFHYATSPNNPGFGDSVVGTVYDNFRYFFSFGWLSDGIFLTPRNLSNLMTQMTVTAILAVGMLMVIVSGNIDLSVGSILGFAGGIAAFSLSSGGLGLPAAICLAVLVAILIGVFQGALTSYLNIPAFIVTLGGLLVWRGAVKWLLAGNTIPISNETFKSIGGGFIGATFGWVLAAAAIIFVVGMAIRRARSVKAYGLGEANYTSELVRSVLPIAGIVAFIWVMNAYEDKGVPVPVLIFVGVALVGGFLTSSTTFGRYLYAIGGNADAARLSGIDIKRNVLKVYAILGALTGLAALISAGRVGSATPDAGTLKELDAIAACVIGGASLMGGRGTIFGACLGALIMGTLDNGMSLLNVRDFMQDIIKGSILVAAVGLDMTGRKQS